MKKQPDCSAQAARQTRHTVSDASAVDAQERPVSGHVASECTCGAGCACGASSSCGCRARPSA